MPQHVALISVHFFNVNLSSVVLYAPLDIFVEYNYSVIKRV